jgi:lipoic acid synthetase
MIDMSGKIRIRVRLGDYYKTVSEVVRSLEIATVCEDALCPNIHDCWSSKTATFMILGDICTRGCRFCYVKKGSPLPPDPYEPYKILEAVKRLGLDYVTITSVDRDDLSDGGASQYVKTIRLLKKLKF